MQLTEKQSFYLWLIQSAEQNKQSIREVVEQNNVRALRLYAAVKRCARKALCQRPTTKEQRNFSKLSVPPLPHDSRVELKTQLPDGQAPWLNIAEAQLLIVLRSTFEKATTD
ncbi:MAG: hypothetical protein Q7V56_15115 [Gammaproteobacteria bacterium]|nr:hypothetical protein [Gammaproteobacteria bacterium]